MTTKAQIEQEARDWLQRQSEDTRASCQQPDSPKKFGEVCMIKVQEGNATKIGWDLARSIVSQPDPTGPIWSDVERSPEEGKRRRVMAENMEKERTYLGESFGFVGKGMIFKDEPGTERWVKKKGFQMAGQERESLMQKISHKPTKGLECWDETLKGRRARTTGPSSARARPTCPKVRGGRASRQRRRQRPVPGCREAAHEQLAALGEARAHTSSAM